MRISISRSLLMGVIISLVPFMSLRAQRATQVVRYSITGVTQGKIDNEPREPGRSGRAAASGTSNSGFGSAAIPTKQTSPSTAVTTSGAPAVGQTSPRVASAAPTTTTRVWQASYQVSNNEENKKLAISIDSPMPEGMQLTADIGAPTGATAAGRVNLETAANDVVTAIGTGESGVVPMAFSLRTPEGSAEDAGARKVTFTFISGS